MFTNRSTSISRSLEEALYIYFPLDPPAVAVGAAAFAGSESTNRFVNLSLLSSSLLFERDLYLLDFIVVRLPLRFFL